MSQRVDIIKAEALHIPRIAEIEAECITDGWSENAFTEALNNKNALIFAAVCDGEVIGFLNGSFVLDEAELLNIAVTAKSRRMGAAGALVESFFAELEVLSVKTVFLEVRESNSGAISLYEKYGFEKSGMRKNYYHNPTENAVLMTAYINKKETD